jgi:hypothetical protein
MTFDPFGTLGRVVAVLEQLSLRYIVVGSLASSYYGVPRATNDVDVVVEIATGSVDALVTSLTPQFYVDEEAVAKAVHERGSFNIVDRHRFDKVDVFVLRADPLDRSLLDRRVRVVIESGSGSVLRVAVPSAEDVILAKLRWYELGHRASDLQRRDILGVLRVQAGRLDHAYLSRMAERLGLSTMLATLLREAEGSGERGDRGAGQP